MKTKLPKPILKSDTNWKARVALTKAQEEKLVKAGLEPWSTRFELWLVGDQWMIPTLSISSRVRHGTRRSYCIGLDGNVYTAGNGPHVHEHVSVYVNRKNFVRLFPVLALLAEGTVKANEIRDRTSTRRARGQLFRAAGRTHWRWDEADPKKEKK